jgi:hypothetical protein
MIQQDLHKPEFEEWLHWSQVLIDRLCVTLNIYSRPPHEDIFMPERERQERNFQTSDLLKRIYALTDETETPTDSLEELDLHAERVVDGFGVLYREALDLMPQISIDMQRLLKSPWHSKFPNRIADNLFRGVMGDERHGIGSGYPEHGRLPSVLFFLMHREKNGGERLPRHEAFDHEPSRNDDITRRWADRNTRALRTAGSMD